jgi:hypothetical protein
MPEEVLPVKAWKYKPKGKRDVGRPRKRWEPEQFDWKPNTCSEEEDKRYKNVFLYFRNPTLPDFKEFMSAVWQLVTSTFDL